MQDRSPLALNVIAGWCNTVHQMVRRGRLGTASTTLWTATVSRMRDQSQRGRLRFEVKNIVHPFVVVGLLRLVLGGHSRGPREVIGVIMRWWSSDGQVLRRRPLRTAVPTLLGFVVYW